ncbi:ComEC/Rec2 family competence protein [Erythrobacter sp. F6033]|uniref:ComEC/Rec2 family competence protein n=1 Tax=Erythrobacter sp. F6033 TaxID=2926401 RepID=UPI001FF13AD1|nr:ComEC/Rec2 family competence protein [Erythrobacter sp. F6033]MCK0128304.1 ComEC family competence protein [Erythrobacter sp. F6033]
MREPPIVPLGNEVSETDIADDVALQRPWQRGAGLSSLLKPGFLLRAGDAAENFLSRSGFDRAPWLAVAFGGGILTWFALKNPWQWTATIGVCILISLAGLAAWRGDDTRGHLRSAMIAVSLVFAAGLSTIWVRSELVGAEPYERRAVERIQGYVLEREDQPAQERTRLTLAIRDPEAGVARKIRINVPTETLTGAEETGIPLVEGAVIKARVRLMPPASPMLPGSYDFARAAWFKGLAATGSVIGPIEIIESASKTGRIPAIQRMLSSRVRERVDGSAGTIAAAFASGDRGAIAEADEEAMRDAGLTHLLSISGLHVSAVIAGAYFLALKLFALFPPIALRIRLPIIAASVGALSGIGYTLLTGAEVPTVRSCAAAMLVLIALAMGRDALSLRMVAAAAVFVLLLWPESIVGPSFQMSFSAVIAIVALHSSSPAKRFLAPREEPWWRRSGRQIMMLFVTGMVIEIALMPIVLFHFHRAGVYGAFANVVAIPMVTFISMPLIAIGLFLDLIGLGKPVWWLVQQSLDALLAIAHFTSSQPGAVKLMPQMGYGTIALFVVGSLWLALWNGSARLLGILPVSLAAAMLIRTPIPDVLIGREGKHVGITVEDPNGGRRLLSLRDSRSSYSRDNLLELASITSDPVPIADWPGARCSYEFCVLEIERGGRTWVLMLARNRDLVEERALAAACERSDIVVADRYLPMSCSPRWLKADRRMLEETGGLSLILVNGRIDSVASRQGEHGWWRGEGD